MQHQVDSNTQKKAKREAAMAQAEMRRADAIANHAAASKVILSAHKSAAVDGRKSHIAEVLDAARYNKAIFRRCVKIWMQAHLDSKVPKQAKREATMALAERRRSDAIANHAAASKVRLSARKAAAGKGKKSYIAEMLDVARHNRAIVRRCVQTWMQNHLDRKVTADQSGPLYHVETLTMSHAEGEA